MLSTPSTYLKSAFDQDILDDDLQVDELQAKYNRLKEELAFLNGEGEDEKMNQLEDDILQEFHDGEKVVGQKVVTEVVATVEA